MRRRSYRDQGQGQGRGERRGELTIQPRSNGHGEDIFRLDLGKPDDLHPRKATLHLTCTEEGTYIAAPAARDAARGAAASSLYRPPSEPQQRLA